MSGVLSVHRRRLPARPDLLALQARFPQRYPMLLESAASHPLTGRYDLLPAFPETVIEARGQAQDFLAELDAGCGAGSGLPQAEDELPFLGGWVVYLGYELAGAIEPCLCLPMPTAGSLPTALALRCPAALIHDHLRGESWAVAERAGDVDRLLVDLAQVPARAPPRLPPCVVTEEDPARYLAAIDRAQHYIRDGDIFQANLSRRWQGEFA
ncbi:MAG TPA: aminodeoxychorismate synthase, component I, partial [Candidatus Macondimonas sp.]|nr:aminodeoxychorismate synthase, component I [Candidatus Macondimonas sp.]